MAAQNDHTTTLELLSQHTLDIATNYAAGALAYATDSGQTDTVVYILQRFTHICAEDAGRALKAAALNNHTETIEAFFQQLPTITPNHVWELQKTAHDGDIVTIQQILNEHTDLST